MKVYGRHYLAEFSGCESDRIKFVEDVRPMLLEAAKLSEATVIQHYFHQYQPHGVTGIILISESHFSLHTWPEDEYVAFDILTCGEMLPENAIEYLKKVFGATDVKIQIVDRGI